MKNTRTNRVIALPASKRGNATYRDRTERRIWKAVKRLRRFCKYHNIQTNHSSTQVAWVTLTYRDNHEGKWRDVSADFNRWTARLRSKYGGKVKPMVQTFRCYESHKSGLVHVHAIVIFFNHAFKTFLHKSGKTGKETQRFEEYQNLKRTWVHGFSDWQGVYDIKGIFKYLTKYLTKQLDGLTDGDMLTTAKLWYHGLRTFSFSRLVMAMHNSNTAALCLETEPHATEEKDAWKLLGFVTCSMVDLTKVFIREVVLEAKRAGTKYDRWFLTNMTNPERVRAELKAKQSGKAPSVPRRHIEAVRYSMTEDDPTIKELRFDDPR